MKLNIFKVTNKEAFIMGAATALGQVLVGEIYRTYVDIDPFKGVRTKIKQKKRKKEFDKIMAQTNLKVVEVAQ